MMVMKIDQKIHVNMVYKVDAVSAYSSALARTSQLSTAIKKGSIQTEALNTDFIWFFALSSMSNG